jgi:hypothetical protein
MTRHLSLAVLLAAAVLSSGCVFGKRGSRPKESSAIASEVEETYRRRWVDQRVRELTAQGATAEAARNQAENEFRERYDFSRIRR